MADSSLFDLFSGVPDHDAIWVEAIGGFENARHRIEQLAAEKPGPYFVFCSVTSAVLVKIDTTRRAEGAA